MFVTLRYHAFVREETGRDSERLELPIGATAGTALEAFARRHPTLAARARHFKFALNDEFAPSGAPLMEGAVLDLLPPFGGG